MTTKLKPKSFGPIFALFDGSDTTGFAVGDPSQVSPHPPTQTPVDMLLASLAHCLVKSVEWAADQHNVVLPPFMVKVEGTKARDLPNRVAKMHVIIIGDLVDDGAVQRKIIKQAKAICTVSNTLNCAIKVSTAPAMDV